MAITASVAFFKNEFIAALSDGRRIERQSWREMAQALYDFGIQDNAIEYQWHTGQRMITAGQQVALRAEIRRLAHAASNHSVQGRAAAA
jgi:hypothetical protein